MKRNYENNHDQQNESEKRASMDSNSKTVSKKFNQFFSIDGKSFPFILTHF
jgi:hypothetical protein